MLQRECRLWQRKLRLQDWNVQVRLVRINEMPEEAIGVIYPVVERKDALMMLLAPIDATLHTQRFQNGEELNYDLTIVHELLHLHLAPFTQRLTDAEQVAEEQAVNAISRSLVSAFAHKSPHLTPPVKVDLPGHYL